MFKRAAAALAALLGMGASADAGMATTSQAKKRGALFTSSPYLVPTVRSGFMPVYRPAMSQNKRRKLERSCHR